MPWLFLLLAIGALTIALLSPSMVLVVVSLLAALALLVIWVLGLVSQRVGSQARDDTQMLDPQELRRLREAAEAMRASQAQAAIGGDEGRAP